MIIGRGLIADSFKRNSEFVNNYDNDCLVFASGVSNSAEKKESEFKREFDLLKESLQNSNNQIVIYFSTLSIYDNSLNSSSYIKHKLSIEDFLLSLNREVLILRAPNVVGEGGNKKTLINHFFSSILQEKEIIIWKNAKRNLLAVDHLVEIVINLLKFKERGIKNIGFPVSYSAQQIVETIESLLQKKAVVKVLDKGEDYLENLNLNQNIKFFNHLSVSEKENYLFFLLKTYYSEYL